MQILAVGCTVWVVPLRVLQCDEYRYAARVELWYTVEGARLGMSVLVSKGLVEEAAVPYGSAAPTRP